MERFIVGLAALFLVLPVSAQEEAAAPRAEPVQVMVLGTYHFANPGQDLNNVEADDVLAPARQRELEALGAALAGFKPILVAVEAEAAPPYVDERYAGFGADDLAKTRNESVQIGYRVARLAGLETVHAIDEQPGEGEPDYFPYGAVAAFAEREGRTEELAEVSDLSAFMQRLQQAQDEGTIPQALMLHNAEMAVPFYWDIIKFGQGEEQPGAELAAYWFMRNAKIFNKLHQVAEPGDRVLVVYGSGHKAWLDTLIEETSGYELVDPLPYLERAQAALEAGKAE